MVQLTVVLVFTFFKLKDMEKFLLDSGGRTFHNGEDFLPAGGHAAVVPIQDSSAVISALQCGQRKVKLMVCTPVLYWCLFTSNGKAQRGAKTLFSCPSLHKATQERADSN